MVAFLDVATKPFIGSATNMTNHKTSRIVGDFTGIRRFIFCATFMKIQVTTLTQMSRIYSSIDGFSTLVTNIHIFSPSQSKIKYINIYAIFTTQCSSIACFCSISTEFHRQNFVLQCPLPFHALIRCVLLNLLLHSVPFRLGYFGLFNAPQPKGATTPRGYNLSHLGCIPA